jgi:hypothetical protein
MNRISQSLPDQTQLLLEPQVEEKERIKSIDQNEDEVRPRSESWLSSYTAKSNSSKKPVATVF